MCIFSTLLSMYFMSYRMHAINYFASLGIYMRQGRRTLPCGGARVVTTSILCLFVLATLSPAVGGARVVTTSILCLFVLATLSPAVGGARVVTTSILCLFVLATLSPAIRWGYSCDNEHSFTFGSFDSLFFHTWCKASDDGCC